MRPITGFLLSLYPMKYLIPLLLLISTSLQAQYKPRLLPPVISSVIGVTDALGEASQHHWDAFHRTFPNANPNYWGPDSWKNKWKNGDPNQGEAFPLSSTALVSFTDYYHLRRTLNKVGWFSTGVTIVIGGKRPVRYYIYDSLIALAANQITFNLTYELIK